MIKCYYKSQEIHIFLTATNLCDLILDTELAFGRLLYKYLQGTSQPAASQTFSCLIVECLRTFLKQIARRTDVALSLAEEDRKLLCVYDVG